MDNLPVEVLRVIGSYLNQVNQKSCTLVCQSWYKIFQPLVFQKAVLTSTNQLTSYIQQSTTLKSLTQSLHFNVPLTDQNLLEFATTCPRIHTLTLFINLLNNLSIPKTVSVIDTYWSRTLIKIRMDELLLPKVLPLLCHQLQDVTGSWSSLLDINQDLIVMPKLLILDVDNDDEYELTIPILDQLRIAYPKLKKLSASYFNLKQVEYHNPIIPFPLVRSFHLLNSNDLDTGLRHIMKMFINLKEYSVIRSYISETSTEDRIKLFKELASVHPYICDLKLDLFTDITLYSCFTRITSLQLEAIPEEDIISHRISVDFIKLVSDLPNLKHFKLYGIVHLESNESVHHYLLNTYQSGCTLTNQLEDDEEEEDQEDESDLFEISTDDIHYSKTEQYKGMQVKKILPKTPIWNIQPNLSTYDPSSLDKIISTTISKLVSLNIEMVTLRNSTFHWLKHNCPLLQELHVLKTEPYPYAVIELGPNIHTFILSFNRRYDSLELPILCLNNTVSLEYVDNEYKQTEYAKQMTRITNAYKIHVNFTTSLREFKFCNHLVPVIT